MINSHPSGTYKFQIYADPSGGSPSDATLVWESSTITTVPPEWPAGQFYDTDVEAALASSPLASGTWVVAVSILSDGFPLIGYDNSGVADPNSWGSCPNHGGWLTLKDVLGVNGSWMMRATAYYYE